MAGWGLRHLSALSGPLVAYEVEVQSLEPSECKKLREDQKGIRFNTFCAIPNDIPDCYADLGSPAYRSDETYHRLLVGMRTGHPCTRDESVEVYAPMSQYDEWIRKSTRQEHLGKLLAQDSMAQSFHEQVIFLT